MNEETHDMEQSVEAERYVLGVDSGGTFTDSVVLADDGRVHFDKASTTPDDLARGTIDSLSNTADSIDVTLSTLLGNARRVAHGTTVATNLLIEEEGAQVGLLTTKGFEDTTVIMRDGLGKSMGVPYRQAMDYLHNERPTPLPEKPWIKGVTERVDKNGNVRTALDEGQVREVVADLVEQGAEAIAVNLLWSFKNPTHEKRVVEIIEDVAPETFVARSSALSPEIGEYERAMTTVLSAYLGPKIDSYIDRLEETLGDAGLTDEFEVMRSTGGLVPSGEASKASVSLINSGPVGGLVAAQQIGQTLGHENIIATDVGGTSFDVGVIRDGSFVINREPFVKKGTPVQIPAAEIKTIGAGGGSIVWTRGNRLRVGPKSVGADPGPACYGQGGTDPTLTDVLLLLGYLNPDSFFGGRMALDVEAAERAVDDIAESLGMSRQEVARGAYEIATSKMADLIRKVTVEQGYDPRKFSLYAYGGAGPAHAVAYGKKLDVEEIVIPQAASVFSAFGIAFADLLRTYSQANNISLDHATSDDLEQTFETLRERAKADLESVGEDIETYDLSFAIDLRYVGQMNELTLETDARPAVADLAKQFNVTYETRYGEGAALEGSEIEATTFRLTVKKDEIEPSLRAEAPGAAGITNVEGRTRQMTFPDTGTVDGQVYDGNELVPGNEITGPAVIEQPRTTIVIPPETSAAIDEYRNVRVAWGEA